MLDPLYLAAAVQALDTPVEILVYAPAETLPETQTMPAELATLPAQLLAPANATETVTEQQALKEALLAGPTPAPMDDAVKLASGVEVPRMPMEQCRHCSRYFRFDVAAKHETSCIMGRGIQRRGKFDAVGHHLRNTPSERFIGQIKQ